MNNQQSRWFSLSCAVALAAAAAACAGNLENPGDFATGGGSGSATGGGAGVGTGGGMGGNGGAKTAAIDPCGEAVFAKSCTGCHGAMTQLAELRLDSARVNDATNYVGVMGKGAADTPNSCTGKGVLVDAANPANSLIYTKVTAATCGSPMPIGPAITSADKACILRWATSVAAAGGGTAGTGGGTGGAGGGTGGAGGGTGGAGAGTGGAGAGTGGASGASGAGGAGTGGAGGGATRDAGTQGGGGARDAGGGARDAGAGGGGNVVRDAARGG